MITKKYTSTIIFIVNIVLLPKIIADNTITLQLQHAPADIIQQVEKTLSEQRNGDIFEQDLKQKTPKQFNQKLLKSEIRALLKPVLSNYAATYGGYIDISDKNGLISFPLRHQGDKVSVALTQSFEPILFEGNTISHIIFNQDTKMYLFEKKTGKKEQVYWEVTEQPIEKGKKNAPTTIVILTNINNIAIIPGSYLTTKTVQFVLPNAFFVVGNTNNEKDLLNSLELRTIFERVSVDKKITNTIEQRRITNY